MTNPPRVEPRINVNCIITPILHPLQSRPDDFCSATYPQQPHGIIEKELSMKQFTTIEKLDTGILYLLELASSLSVLLLAFGLIASMAKVLIWIRSVAIVLLIVAHALRHVHAQKLSVAEAGNIPQPLVLTPELLSELRLLLAQTTVSEEQPETRQITETASGTDTDGQAEEMPTTPDTTLFPDVPEEERNKVIAAYTSGIPRRDICSHLRWGNAKYSTIVKPVLDRYEHQAGTQEQVTSC